MASKVVIEDVFKKRASKPRAFVAHRTRQAIHLRESVHQKFSVGIFHSRIPPMVINT